MSKSPAFQFYPNDYLGSARVAELTLEEEGAYLRALLYCWNHGSLPADVERLARVIGKGCSTDVATNVQRMFQRSFNDETRLIHPRLEDEREKQERRRAQTAEAGRISAKTRTKSNERSTDAPTDVITDVERNINPSSSISASHIELTHSTHVRAHEETVQAAPDHTQHSYPRSLDEVKELAVMLGFSVAAAERYYNRFKSEAWCSTDRFGNKKFIADWKAHAGYWLPTMQADIEKLEKSGSAGVTKSGGKKPAARIIIQPSRSAV